MKRETIMEIALRAAGDAERICATAEPAKRLSKLTAALAKWVEHAVVREVTNDRRRVRRRRSC